MQITALFLSSFLLALSGAIVPGPLLTATIAACARRGFWAGPQIVLGHAILELLVILALLGGFSALLTKTIVIYTISIAGGLLLIVLGFSMLKDVLSKKLNFMNLNYNQLQGTDMHPILTGIFISLFNPYWIIWWATIGLGYLTLALQSGSVGVLCFYNGHILADLAWYSLIALIIASGRNFLNQRIYNFILFFCGLFLIGLGIYFIYTAIAL